MWPEIVKQELGDVEFFNFGQKGAGNQFIAHQLYKADAEYNFNSDDLVMVCWSSAFRNDWFVTPDNVYQGFESSHKLWVTEGNAFYPGQYGSQLHSTLKDLNHYTIRDASIISGAVKFLEESDCQSHQLAIINNFVNDDQDHGLIEQQILDHPECKPYVDYLRDKIAVSFWDAGYDLDFIMDYWKNTLGIDEFCRDDHPLPIWSMEYLSNTFDHEFTKETRAIVYAYHDKLCEALKKYKEYDYDCNFSEMLFNHYPWFEKSDMSLVNFLD